ncbi:MAG: OmpP1/FadL family transporter [bacterium]
MHIPRSLRALVLFACLAPATANAAGYAIYEQGAAALGMAGAYVASANDATAQFYNPAAMVNLKGRQLSVGGTWLSTYNSFAGEDPYPGTGVVEEMNRGNFFPPTIYWTNRFRESLAYGFGVNAPFGLGVDWKNPESFTGRERVTKALLESVDASFSVAWRMSPNWSVAGGPNMRMAKVELNQIGTFVGSGGAPINVSRAQLTSDFERGMGWHAAIHGTPWKQWRFGAAYRSKVEVDVEKGRAEFTQMLTGDPVLDATIAAGLPPKQDAKTKLVFPAQLAFGFAWDPAPGWTYEIDGVWSQWSSFAELPLDFATSNELDQVIREDYRDQMAVRVGAEHRLDTWTYRAGYYFDAAAAPVESVTPLLPDASRHGATLGFGRRFGKWTLDAYNLFLFVEKRSTEGRERDGYNGVYKSYVNALGATLAYHW